MKKLILVVMAVSLVAGLALAAETKTQVPASATSTTVTTTATTAPVIETITIKGDIIDNMCAGSQKAEALAAFVKTHTKECALKPQCMASGYAIFSDGMLLKFDAASNTKIADFLKKPDSKLQVVAVVKKEPLNALSLVSIENQK